MEPHPNPKQSLPGAPAPPVGTSSESQKQTMVPAGNGSRSAQSSLSAALAVARAEGRRAFDAPGRFPGEEGEGRRGYGGFGSHSLAEMAQRDLDAALQLLAERAQYITGANGAAIALRREGKNDMLCRASAGGNAPELGALFSTEFGLSGESVRARQPLRCDDADRDRRVNRDVCRELGIASVVVMPVVQDDEVLGVFELFSGKAHAFGERDLSALRRLSEMVETAVKLAHASDCLQERLKTAQPVAEKTLAIPAIADRLVTNEAPGGAEEARGEAKAELEWPVLDVSATTPAAAVDELARETGKPAPARKQLFWSAADKMSSVVPNLAEAETSHIPPVLRNLAQCAACGFPVSLGRKLCVECEEKKWRGQLGTTPAGALRLLSPVSAEGAPGAKSAAVTQSAAMAQAVGAGGAGAAPALAAQVNEYKDAKPDSPIPSPPSQTAGIFAPANAPAQPATAPLPEVILSGGLEPSRSWISANRYVLGTLLVVGAIVAAVLLLR